MSIYRAALSNRALKKGFLALALSFVARCWDFSFRLACLFSLPVRRAAVGSCLINSYYFPFCWAELLALLLALFYAIMTEIQMYEGTTFIRFIIIIFCFWLLMVALIIVSWIFFSQIDTVFNEAVFKYVLRNPFLPFTG